MLAGKTNHMSVSPLGSIEHNHIFNIICNYIYIYLNLFLFIHLFIYLYYICVYVGAGMCVCISQKHFRILCIGKILVIKYAMQK
jgi:hypothetical protein